MISKKLLALFLFVAAIAAAVLLFSSTVDYHGSGAVSAAEGLGSVDQSVVALVRPGYIGNTYDRGHR